VGIGTSSPSSIWKATIQNTAAIPAGFDFKNSSGTSTAQIGLASAASGSDSNNLYLNATGLTYFYLNNSESARLEPSNFRLTATRVVFNGATAVPGPINNGDGSLGTYAQYGITLIGKGSSYDISFFNKNGSVAGYVATGATSITTSSDEKLKENNQPITGALDIVCQMRHETGNYKSDPDRTVAFLIAQDVDALFPYAVEKADPESWGVNYNWIIPLHGAAIAELTALVKEQQALITTLTDRITALETPTGTQA
jgi:hypothetical protein